MNVIVWATDDRKDMKLSKEMLPFKAYIVTVLNCFLRD